MNIEITYNRCPEQHWFVETKNPLYSISSRSISAIGIPKDPSTLLEARQYISNKYNAPENKVRGSPCLNINVIHHDMKSHGVLIPNVMKCVNMSLVHIDVCIRRELHCLMPSSTPLVDCSIKLKILIITQ
jgi:hypothetical protein